VKRWENAAINSATGAAVPNPSITVFHQGTGVQATVYSDEGTTTLSQPFSGDSLGRFWFYAPDGDYDIQVAGTGLTTYTISDVTIVDDKRITGLDEHNVFALANAFYHRQAAEWRRKDTGRPAWAIELDADVAENRIRILRATAAANPITWVEVFRIIGVATPANYLDFLLAAASAHPELRAQGTDPNVNIGLRPMGTGKVQVLSGDLETTALARISGQNRFRFLRAMVRARKSSTQSMSADTEAAVTFNTEDYDTDGLHDNSTNPSRFTATIAGKYSFRVTVRSGGNTSFRLRLRVNGTTVIFDITTVAVAVNNVQGAADYNFAANDYIEALITTVGAGETLQAGTDGCNAEFRYIGE